MPTTPPAPRAQAQPLLIAGYPLTVARVRNFLRAWDQEPLDQVPFAVFALRHLLGLLDRIPAHLSNQSPVWGGVLTDKAQDARQQFLVAITNHLRLLDHPDPPDAFWLKAPRQPGLVTNAQQTSGRMPAYRCLCELQGVPLMSVQELPTGGDLPRHEVTSQRACAACNGELDPVVDQADIEGFLAAEAQPAVPAGADPARPPEALRTFFTPEEIAAAKAEAEQWPFTAGPKSGTMELPQGKAPESFEPAGLFDQPQDEEGLF